MATTRIMPLHVGKGRTESRAISDIIDYVANPKKTDDGRLITGYACDSRTVDAEFLLAKRQYIAATGRVRGADDVIAYHVRQSFRPGEITPEEANRLGVEFAKRFTKGNHAFVVCTHIDKSHIHNHIIWSSVSLNSVYTRSGQNSTPNSNATNLHSSQKRCCSFCISSSNASPTFQVQKSIFHQMTKPIQVTVILPLLLAISFSRNDDIHSSISGISNDLIGVIPTIGQ